MSRVERDRLLSSYRTMPDRPSLLVAGCAVGLAALIAFIAHGGSSDPQQLAAAREAEAGRLSVEQSALQHERDLYSARRIAREERLDHAMLKQVTLQVR